MGIDGSYILDDHVSIFSGSTKQIKFLYRWQGIEQFWQRGQDVVSPLRLIMVVVD